MEYIELGKSLIVALGLCLVFSYILSKVIPENPISRLAAGIFLLIPFIYIGHGIMPILNGQYILYGIQWGFFAGAMNAFNSVLFKKKNINT